jgi:hypothetical protein
MSHIKNIVRFFILHDWMYSVLGAFFAYFLLNLGPQEIAGVAIGYYAVNWPQALIATAGAMAGLMAIIRIGMWFNQRILHNWIWAKKDLENPDHKYSSTDFKSLSAWQRTLLSIGFFFFFFTVGFFLFLQFLKMGAPLM